MKQADRLMAYRRQRKPGWRQGQPAPRLTPRQARRMRKRGLLWQALALLDDYERVQPSQLRLLEDRLSQ